MKDTLHSNLGNIMYIYEVLKKYSDVNHILSISEIIEYIEKDYNETIEARTVRRNIRVLIEKFNIDISTFSENRKGYFLAVKDFEMSEIQTLIGLMKYSKFMDESFSNDIIERLKKLLNVYELDLVNQLDISDVYSKNIKTINKEVLNNIEIILESIKNKTKIKFEYYLYGLDKKLHKVCDEEVSPYAIVCENEFYYLIAYHQKYKTFSYFRIDRIKNIQTTKFPITKTKQSVKDFVESSVYMYGGEKEQIELKCDMAILDYVIEKFGNDIFIEKIDNKYFKVILNVYPMGLEMWILQYIKYVEVLYPTQIKENIKNILKEGLKKYE